MVPPSAEKLGLYNAQLFLYSLRREFSTGVTQRNENVQLKFTAL